MTTTITGATGVNQITDGTITATDFAVGVRGKVLQTTSNSGITTTSGTGNNTFYSTVVTGAITPISTTSKMYISYFVGFNYNNNASNGGYSTRLQRAISGGATSYPLPFLHDNGTPVGNAHGMMYENAHSGPTIQAHSHGFTGLDGLHGTSSNIVYTLQAANFNIDGLGVGRGYGATWNMVIMEIEQ